MKPRILARLISAYHWTKALGDELAGEPGMALARIARMEELLPLRPFEQAYKGLLLLNLSRFDEADDLFEQTIQGIGEPEGPNGRYVQIVCHLWKKDRFADLAEADRLWLEASTIACSSMLRRYLVLHDKMPSELVADRKEIRVFVRPTASALH